MMPQFGLAWLVLTAFSAASIAASHPQRPRFTVGFNLGQSYGTAVVRYANGTVHNLAKVEASAEHARTLRRLVKRHMPGYWLSMHTTIGYWLGLLRDWRRHRSLPIDSDAAVLSRMIAALKAESEAILREPIKHVAVTMPYIRAWSDQLHRHGTVLSAVALAGLEPLPWVDDNYPPYLGELNALFVANQRYVCLPGYCGRFESGREDGDSRNAYIISFTNHSLYTSIQPTWCFFHDPHLNEAASIDPKFGLEQAAQASSPAAFWAAMRELLVGKADGYSKRNPHSRNVPFAVFLAGEAIDNKEFREVITDLIRTLPQIQATTEEATASSTTADAADLVVPSDPIFAAARGAAIWLWMQQALGVCDGYNDADHDSRINIESLFLHEEL